MDPHLARHRARASLGRPAPPTTPTWRRRAECSTPTTMASTDVKDRIVEYLAVRARRADRGLQVVGGRGSGAVLVLVGPPGVGKTSLGESVAHALGRKFVRVALGGVRDEAEIRGHRRTYVGALPGRIVRAIGEAGSMNPVMLLDEIDKVGSDYRGDPAAALLEVLDPAQNHTFRDHYLEIDLDLSDVLFLATANVVDTIPPALLDRMELITMDGYTEDDKVVIARTHLLPRQRERAAIGPDEVERDRRGVAADRVRLHPRGGGTSARAVAGQGASARSPPSSLPAPSRPSALASRGSARIPGPAAFHARDGRAHGGAGRRHRPRSDRHGRRRAVHRGQRDGRQARLDPDRPARRRDEGVRADRAVLPPLARGRARHRPVATGSRAPPARAGRRRPEGRAVRGRDDGDRACVAGHRPAGALGRRR